MQLYFIRHGESQANVDRLVTGSVGTPLTDKGIQQVKALYSLTICKLNMDLIFSSTAKRAIQTAELLFPQREIIPRNELLETDAGTVAEWSIIKFNQHYPDFWSSFDPYRSYPNGESHYDLYVRVNSWLDECQTKFKSKNNNIAIVTHGGPINCVLHRFNKVPLEQYPYYEIKNASVLKVCI